MSAEIVSVVNQKGGTGKTTTTMNLGCALQQLGKRVLLVDLDPQGNLSYSLGITEPEKTMVDVITGQCSAKDALVEREGVDIIPGSPDMADIEVSLAGQEQREKFLKKALSGLSSQYDYILIDSPPSLSLLTINALNAAQSVVVPMQLEVLTLQGLNQILSTVDAVKKTMNTKLKVKGILLVMYDKRRKLSQELQNFLEENVKNRVYESVIRLNVKLAEAPSFGQSVIKYDPSSNGAKDYMAFAKEFLGQPA
ncbi:MAG: ParA family protein [Chitinophagaceae bacterium]|nr:MAG: ParA family protein [Chitinophagaceae bacterium]